jgi:chaperonin cofactor prefoldin
MKLIHGVFQVAIIILALVLIVTIGLKQNSTSALEDFERKINQELQQDRARYDLKVKTLEDNLNRYQQLRETRAQIFGKRVDELYDLYKKDPTPILAPNKAEIAVEEPSEIVSSKNLIYLENKINKVDEKTDDVGNRLSGRVDVLEKRFELIQADKKSGQKIIQNSIQTQNNNQTK